MEIKIGDFIWVELSGASQNYGCGEIKEIWEEKHDIVFMFHCQVNGGYRMGELKKIIKKPGSRMKSKMYEEQCAIRKLKQK